MTTRPPSSARLTRDHRGLPVALCDETTLPAEAPRALRNLVVIAAKSRPRRIVTRVGVLAVAIVASRILFQLATGRWNPVELVGSGLTIAVVAGVLVIAARLSGRGRDRRAVEACLAAAICPGCGYMLTALPAQADGCRVCPECGSAWKLDA